MLWWKIVSLTPWVEIVIIHGKVETPYEALLIFKKGSLLKDYYGIIILLTTRHTKQGYV